MNKIMGNEKKNFLFARKQNNKKNLQNFIQNPAKQLIA